MVSQPLESGTSQAEGWLPLGGAPRFAPSLDHDDGKAERKRRKRESKLREDAARPPESFERWRILMDVVDEGRRIVDLVDHKARYALVAMGALNAGVFLILSRTHLLPAVPPAAKPWLIGVLMIYAGLSFLFVYHAVDCLRPREMRQTGLVNQEQGRRLGGEHAPLGLLYWETAAAYELPAYQQAWSAARMEQLNAELVLINHHLSRLIQAKYATLRRLYRSLGLLVILAAILLLGFASFALVE